jgi:biotin carboxyl carrier protein
MKMENELRATQAGTVAQIAVAEGTKVEGGTLLVVIRSQ